LGAPVIQDRWVYEILTKTDGNTDRRLQVVRALTTIYQKAISGAGAITAG